MWYALAVVVAALIIGQAMSPRTQAIKPAGLDEFQAPTAEVGREIPVAFGTVDVRGPNVVWYGDLRSTPIRK
ncbi:hypothetical protein [Vibrio phage PH669]|uniref:Tail assembly protein n=1 Tax=Vibrio phage PH669 TaxID=2800823 RepID=A0A7U3WDZ7_9CAUD|nr:hypothetical protein [Vibrio phage PH669]